MAHKQAAHTARPAKPSLGSPASAWAPFALFVHSLPLLRTMEDEVDDWPLTREQADPLVCERKKRNPN